MRGHKGFTLRTAVNALVLLGIVVTAAICALVGYTSEKQSLTRTTFQMNQVYASKISDTVNGLFANLFESLDVFGRYLATDLKRADLHRQFQLFQQTHTNFNAVFMIDRDGRLVEGSNLLAADIGRKIDSAGTKQALQLRRPVVSEPYMSATTNKLIVMVSQPLFDAAGNYTGFIGGSIRLHETSIFQTILGTTVLREDGSYAYVASGTGMLLYHPEADRIGQKMPSDQVATAISRGESGNASVSHDDGPKMFASYAYIDRPGWGIISQTPAAAVLSSARQLVEKLLLYMLPALLVVAALIYWIVGRLAAPFASLALFARRLSPAQSGNDQLPAIHGWSYEANELHKAFGRAVRHFRYQFDHLRSEAETDALTGLYNRRSFDHFVKQRVEEKRPFSMLILDLDNFKSVNDTYGHDKGDEVLRYLAGALRSELSSGTTSCRLGGEEFVVLVPGDAADAAMQEAERVRRFMANTISPTGERVTVSIGVATYPAMAPTAEALFRLADDALYQAKRDGRNRVVLAGDMDEKIG